MVYFNGLLYQVVKSDSDIALSLAVMVLVCVKFGV